MNKEAKKQAHSTRDAHTTDTWCNPASSSRRLVGRVGCANSFKPIRKSLHGSNSPNLFPPHSNGLRCYAPGAHQHLPGVASVTLCAAPFYAAHVVSMPNHTSGLRMCAGVCSVA